MRGPRDDGLGAGAGVAAPHPVDLGGRPGPDPLQRAEALLAVGGAALARLGEPPLLVERQPGEQVPFLLRQRQHPVVEPGQGDPALLVVQAGQQARHRVQRVRHPAAERAGVQVPDRPGQRDLDRDQPAHAGAHGRHVGGPHGGVADHDHVAGQPLPLAPEQVGEVLGARLLLALDEQLDGDRRRGGAELAARQARTPREWNSTWPLSSEAPRPSSRPSRSAGSNGGLSHSSSGSTGWTS